MIFVIWILSLLNKYYSTVKLISLFFHYKKGWKSSIIFFKNFSDYLWWNISRAAREVWLYCMTLLPSRLLKSKNDAPPASFKKHSNLMDQYDAMLIHSTASFLLPRNRFRSVFLNKLPQILCRSQCYSKSIFKLFCSLLSFLIEHFAFFFVCFA